MKKRLLVIMMSLIMGGLTATPKNVVTAKAEAVKLDAPNLVVTNWNANQGFHENGELEMPWEYLTATYKKTGLQVKQLASLEVAFFPYEEEFNETATYATLIREAEGNIPSGDIVSALKSAWVSPDVEYAVALRYLSKNTAEYTNSDWCVPLKDVTMTEQLKAKYAHKYDFNYKLERYSVDSFGAAGNDETRWEYGDLKYAYEILTEVNPEHNYIDYMEVLVFDGTKYDNSSDAPAGAIKEVDDNVKPLTTFKVEKEGPITKSKIEGYLTAANLKPGKYSFSARIIAKENSHYENSDLYPLSPAREYSPALLSEVNMASNKNMYASADADLKVIADGNKDSRATINPDANGQGWLIIDLGANYYLSSMSVLWERARAADYDVYIAKNIDPSSFNLDVLNTMTSVVGKHDVADPNGNTTDTFALNDVSGRYVILSFLKAATPWGYSIYEVEVYQNPDVPESQKFIDDWKDLRDADGNICGALNDKVALDALIKRYDALSDADKTIVNATADIDGVTIQESVEYLRGVLAGTTKTDGDYGITPAENPSNILAEVKDSSTIVILVAILGVIAISAYYFIEKRKLAK